MRIQIERPTMILCTAVLFILPVFYFLIIAASAAKHSHELVQRWEALSDIHHLYAWRKLQLLNSY